MVAQGDGATLSNSTSATSLLPAQSKRTIQANEIDNIGRWFRITAYGKISNIVTTPGTLILDIRLGAAVVFNGAAMQLSTTAHTDVPWKWEVMMVARTLGSSATMIGQSVFHSQAVSVSGADPTTGHSYLMAPNTAPAAGSSFDSTAALVLDLFGKFSIGDPGNSITCNGYLVESNLSII
jgi:hypothetical protein